MIWVTIRIGRQSTRVPEDDIGLEACTVHSEDTERRLSPGALSAGSASEPRDADRLPPRKGVRDGPEHGADRRLSIRLRDRGIACHMGSDVRLLHLRFSLCLSGTGRIIKNEPGSSRSLAWRVPDEARFPACTVALPGQPRLFSCQDAWSMAVCHSSRVTSANDTSPTKPLHKTTSGSRSRSRSRLSPSASLLPPALRRTKVAHRPFH